MDHVSSSLVSPYRMLQAPFLFEPAAWQRDNILPSKIPSYKLSLGRFPTPIHEFKVPGLEACQVWIKRDDLTSCDLSGNKVRKLEFLLADALQGGYDSVITIGGLQSNHARATAVASRQLGLEPHLILRTTNTPEEIDLTGNLLWNRMIGSKIYTVSPGSYARIGSNNLVSQLQIQLKDSGKNPYCIPVGGSNALGSFGYMETIREIISCGVDFDHIIFGCGSGGTAAGIAIGVKLAGLKSKVHAVGVCDSPQYFYDHIDQVAKELGIDYAIHGNPQEWCSIYNGQGMGYARSTEAELTFLLQVARATGIVLDPVYSGKALYYFTNEIIKSNEIKESDKILFIHTGGTFGFYDKAQQLIPLLPKDDIQKLVIRP
jgi:D-cysteine desulfhydrase